MEAKITKRRAPLDAYHMLLPKPEKCIHELVLICDKEIASSSQELLIEFNVVRGQNIWIDPSEQHWLVDLIDLPCEISSVRTIAAL